MICGVLAVAGVAKIVSPRPTRQAISLVGLPMPDVGVRLIGLAEMSIAAATVVVGGTALPIAVGAIHLVFAVVVLILRRRPGATSCGCFGSLDTPVSGLHLVANLVSAAIAFAAIGGPGLGSVVADQPGGGLAYLLLVATGTAGAVAVLTLLPRLSLDVTAAPAFSLRASR
jgi:hypothetical protein